MTAEFYLYEHTRRDNGAVFYVGKGKGHRARSLQGRNPFWHRIAAKGYDIAIVVRGLPEELAHFAECERIAQLRAMGVRLANLTDGGEGASGAKIPRESVERRAALMRGRPRPDVSARLKGVPKSAEHRAAQSAACMGRVLSDETKKKIGEKSKGRQSSMLGKRHSEETKEKIGAAVRGEKNPFFGKTHPPEIVAMIKKANIGRRDSDETRQRKSESKRGEKHHLWGVPVPEDRKQKQIATLKARPKVTCPHCSRTMDESNAKRWHLDNCREKK